jgi:hypothetical protein
METPNTASLSRQWLALGATDADLLRVLRTYNANAPEFRAQSRLHERGPA